MNHFNHGSTCLEYTESDGPTVSALKNPKPPRPIRSHHVTQFRRQTAVEYKREGEEESCHFGENGHEGRMVSGSLWRLTGLAVPPSRIERLKTKTYRLARQKPIKTKAQDSRRRHKTKAYQDKKAYQDSRQKLE